MHLAPGSQWNYGDDFYWPLNPHLEAEGDASVDVEYGNEGSPLIEDYSPFPELVDDELIEMSGPRCYLQLVINGPRGVRIRAALRVGDGGVGLVARSDGGV